MLTAFTGAQAATTHELDTFKNTYGAQLVLQVKQTAGAGSDTVVVEVTLNGTDWVALSGIDVADATADAAPAASGIFRFDVTGFEKIRIRKTGTTDTFSAWYNYVIA